jgi:hypothetical protein
MIAPTWETVSQSMKIRSVTRVPGAALVGSSCISLPLSSLHVVRITDYHLGSLDSVDALPIDFFFCHIRIEL